MKIKTILTLLLLTQMFNATAATLNVPESENEANFTQTLIRTLAARANLEINYPYGQSNDIVTFERMRSDIKSGVLDVIWTATSREYEEDMLALYYPIYRGILGMRVGIVRSDNVNLFSGVRNLNDLKKFTAGSGKGWTDTNILLNSGLNVVETTKYPNLFPMLEGGRFDYFPRGIHEPWREIQVNSALNLAVEPNLLISYKMPMYFFLKKDNFALAKKLTTAMEEIIYDGTFEKLFYADPQVKGALDKSNVKNRRVIEITNPYLTTKAPLNRKELWFDPQSLN